MNFSAGTVNKINEHIIEFCFNTDVEISEKISIEILNAIHVLSEEKPYALLYDFNKCNILISEIARKFSSVRNYNNSNIIARAIVTQSLSSSLETSHYIKNSNIAAETNMFETKEKAISWLNEKTAQFLKPQ
ncbi:MAG TPA: hypothetical protein VNZ49_10560 [Bacteroidia bacterium]|jgi:hypothetical protein|nr:hypothetical protein [Bacteroidia bacterium]